MTKEVKSSKMDDAKKIEKEIQILHIWVKEVSYNANWDQTFFSLAALRAVLQELRDHLALKDLAHLSAQLFKILVKHISHSGKGKMRKILPESIEICWLEAIKLV